MSYFLAVDFHEFPERRRGFSAQERFARFGEALRDLLVGADHPDGESGVGQDAVALGGSCGVVQYGVEDARSLFGGIAARKFFGAAAVEPDLFGCENLLLFRALRP